MDLRERICLNLGAQQLALIEAQAEIERLTEELNSKEKDKEDE